MAYQYCIYTIRSRLGFAGYYQSWHSQHVYVFQGISLYYDYNTNASVVLCRFMFPLFLIHPAFCPFGFKF